MNPMWKRFKVVFLVALASVLVLTACGTGDSDKGGEKDQELQLELGQKSLTMPYVAWASTEAAVNVLKAVLDKIGYDVELRQVEAAVIFASLADGSADMSVGAVTLPHTHADYWEEYGDELDDISVTIEKDITIGLAVPTYMDIDSLEDLTNNTGNIGEAVDWTLVGIDPGAGQMQLTENVVMPEYGLSDKWTLQPSSGPAMTSALSKAIDAEDPIIVTLWEPHWAFIEWDLKYLEDPKNLFGDPDSLHAVGRKDLKEDAPAAYKVLEQFQWSNDGMGEVMVDIHHGMEPLEAAKKWVDENEDLVNEWLEGIIAE